MLLRFFRLVLAQMEGNMGKVVSPPKMFEKYTSSHTGVHDGWHVHYWTIKYIEVSGVVSEEAIAALRGSIVCYF